MGTWFQLQAGSMPGSRDPVGAAKRSSAGIPLASISHEAGERVSLRDEVHNAPNISSAGLYLASHECRRHHASRSDHDFTGGLGSGSKGICNVPKWEDCGDEIIYRYRALLHNTDGCDDVLVSVCSAPL